MSFVGVLHEKYHALQKTKKIIVIPATYITSAFFLFIIHCSISNHFEMCAAVSPPNTEHDVVVVALILKFCD
jgi:hypothetical protein